MDALMSGSFKTSLSPEKLQEIERATKEFGEKLESGYFKLGGDRLSDNEINGLLNFPTDTASMASKLSKEELKEIEKQTKIFGERYDSGYYKLDLHPNSHIHEKKD